MSQPDWDDERLAAAFHARFGRGAPATLAGDVDRALAVTRPSRIRGLGRGATWVLATAAVIVVLAGGTLIGLGGLGRLGPGPSLDTDVATVPPSGTGSAVPSTSEPPSSVAGLDVIKVSAALAVRDAGVDDREIAVRGWFTPAPAISCGPAPAVRAVSPVQLRCPDQNVWLTEAAESLVHVNGNQEDVGGPHGPALNPDLDGLGLSWEPLPLTIGTDAASVPAQVVLVGHFDDRRASSCPTEEVAACRDRFVVDQVAWADGVAQPRSQVGLTDAPWTSSVASVESVVAEEASESPILSIQIIHGVILADTQPSIEPSLANGQGGLTDRPGLWIVRVLESGRLATYIVDDGNGRIYEMNPDGQAVYVGGQPAPSASAAAEGPWPPPGATVVTLTSPVVPGAQPVQVAVVDRSGRLIGVAEKGAVDPTDPTLSLGDPGAYAEPGKPGRIHVAWTGSICDSRITVTIADDLKTIAFDMGRRPICDAIGIGREFVLDFSGTVDVSTIEFLVASADHAPATAERGYDLDCASLDQATCERRAAGIVANYLSASPPKRVIAVRLTDDPCGSFSVDFDDGTGGSTMIDCFISPDPS